MPLKQDFADQLKAQTNIWQAQIKDYQEQLERTGEKARAEYTKAVTLMETNAEQARKLLSQVQSANETAWKDIQGGTLNAFRELQKSWADALSRFG